MRFIHDLYEFNNQERIESTFYKFRDLSAKDKIAGQTSPKHRKPLVDILAFCLMPNHYHLLLSPKIESGVPKFMQKLNMGYAKYFNKKYDRTGALFQGKYKQIQTTSEAHFDHMSFYIHFNPLDLSCPEWRENKLSDKVSALGFLKSYRWSSHLDYLGIKNFPSVLNMALLNEVFGGIKGYENKVANYLTDIEISPETTLE